MPSMPSNFYHVLEKLHEGTNLLGGKGAKLKEVRYGVANLKICHFARQKRQYNVFMQGNLVNPGPFD